MQRADSIVENTAFENFAQTSKIPQAGSDIYQQLFGDRTNSQSNFAESVRFTRESAKLIDNGVLSDLTIVDADSRVQPSDVFRPALQNQDLLEYKLFPDEGGDRLNQRTSERESPLGRIEVPTAEDVRTSPIEKLQDLFERNQANLVQSLSQILKDLPVLGFHGTSREGIEGLMQDKEATSPFYVATIWKKAEEAGKHLLDLFKNVSFADGYVKPGGGLVVVDMPSRTRPNGEFPGVSRHDDMQLNPLIGVGEHTGESTIDINPENFHKRVIGVVDPSKNAELKHAIENPSDTESWNRYYFGNAFYKQALVQAVLDLVTKAKNLGNSLRGSISDTENGGSGSGQNRELPITSPSEGYRLVASKGGNEDGGDSSYRLHPEPIRDGVPPSKAMAPERDNRKSNPVPTDSDDSDRRIDEAFDPTRPPGIDGMRNGETGSGGEHVDWRDSATPKSLADGTTMYDYKGELTDQVQHNGDKVHVHFDSSVVVGSDNKTILGSNTRYNPPVDQTYVGVGLRADQHVIDADKPTVRIEGVQSVTTMQRADGGQTSIVVSKNGTYIFEVDKDNVVDRVVTPAD